MVKNNIKDVFHKIEARYPDAYLCCIKFIGHPHILLLKDGKCIFVYVSGHLLPFQNFFLENIRANGGYVVSGEYIEDIISQIEQIFGEDKYGEIKS